MSLALVLGLAACAPPASLQPDSPGPQISGNGICDASRVAWAVGQKATQDTMAKVWKQSGSGLIRPLAPNQAATMDFRPDRITVHIDADNVISQLECG
ncbi:MAG TPA: hypothetical protein DDZ67_13695 [Xanthomonadaceae bacterium]|nr:hypothetical protein [Xanthomonadaceae bacterium]